MTPLNTILSQFRHRLHSITPMNIILSQFLHCLRTEPVLNQSLHCLRGITVYSAFAFTDKPECICHFPAPGRKCTTKRQALKDFPGNKYLSIRKMKPTHVLWEVLKILSFDWCVLVYQWKLFHKLHTIIQRYWFNNVLYPEQQTHRTLIEHSVNWRLIPSWILLSMFYRFLGYSRKSIFVELVRIRDASHHVIWKTKWRKKRATRWKLSAKCLHSFRVNNKIPAIRPTLSLDDGNHLHIHMRISVCAVHFTVLICTTWVSGGGLYR
jgi:hypothetical protein